MRHSTFWILMACLSGCTRPMPDPPAEPEVPPRGIELPQPADPPSALLTPEASDGAMPQRLDATRPIARPTPQPRSMGFLTAELIPDLPLRKPSKILGDTRLLVRDHSSAVAVSPDGKWLVCGTTFFDRKTGEEAFSLRIREENQVSRAAFSGDSKLLFSQNYDNAFSVWDVPAKEHVLSLQTTDWAITPDGSRLATIEWIEVGQGLHNDGLMRRLVVRIRDTKTWKETAKFAVNGFFPTAIAIAPDGATLALGGMDGTIRTWDIEAAKELPKLAELSVDPGKTWRAHYKPAVVKIAFRADGKQLAASNGGVQLVDGARSVAIWDWPDGKLCHRWVTGSHDLSDLRFSHDGKYLVAAGYGTVWNLATGKVEAQLDAHRDKQFFTSFDFAPGGDRLYTRGQSLRAQLLEFPSLKPLPFLDPPLADDPPKLPFETAGDFAEWNKEVKLRDGSALRAGPYEAT